MDSSQFKKIKTDAGGIVVNNKTGHIALVKMHHNVWGFPKGEIMDDEGPLGAAQRQVFEETGIKDLELVKELPSYKRANSYDKQELLAIDMFLFKTDENKLEHTKNDIAETKWSPKEDVVISLTLQEDKEYFESILKEIQ